MTLKKLKRLYGEFFKEDQPVIITIHDKYYRSMQHEVYYNNLQEAKLPQGFEKTYKVKSIECRYQGNAIIINLYRRQKYTCQKYGSENYKDLSESYCMNCQYTNCKIKKNIM